MMPVPVPWTAAAAAVLATATASSLGGVSGRGFCYDVVVQGATPGGVAAAVAAGRGGAHAALLEPGLYVGGAMSGGLGLSDYGMHAPRVLGGISREFFERVAAHYGVPFTFPPDNQCGKHAVPWVSEPHVAEEVFVDMLRDANVTVLLNTRPVAAQLDGEAGHGPRITALTTADGRTVCGRAFVDGSYEGLLLKLAGVRNTWGREANTTYNESTAGRLPPPDVPDAGFPDGQRTAQLPRGISPYTDDSNTTLVAGVWGGEVAAPGAGDDRVGSYDWRLTLTDNVSNMVPIPPPDNYDPAEFELLRRALGRGFGMHVPSFNTAPGRKSDWKMFGTFGEHPNFQWSYPNGTWQQQQSVVAEFKRYALALIHFSRTDPAVPQTVRDQMNALGLCKDEYNRSAHWMPQLYVRTALRMVGSTILTQKDVTGTEWHPVADGIGVASYTVDVPGPVQTIVWEHDGQAEVINEGALKAPYFCDPSRAPFALPYSAMVPRQGDVTNLIVPVALSASHIAFNAIRMEPTWMVLGMSAGVAAAMLTESHDGVQNGSNAGDPARTFASLDVGSLRLKLVELGQTLEPKPPKPAPPPGPPPGPPPAPPSMPPGNLWYAWKEMWQVVDCAPASSNCSIISTEQRAVLKKGFASSHDLPSEDVRFYAKGAVVSLSQTPANANDAGYWLVKTTPSPPSRRPHLIFVMVDDWGFFEAGFKGNVLAQTPFIDSMVAKEALLIERHYSYRFCSPARRSFLTGRLPPHVGQTNSADAHIDFRMSTLAEKLAAAGYATGHSGKWHAGFFSVRQTPFGRGFSTSLGFLYGVDHWTQQSFEKVCKYGHGGNSTDLWDNDRPAYGMNGTYGDYMYVGHAVDTIMKHNASVPLFYYLATEVAHLPNEAPPRFRNKFDPKTVPFTSVYAMSSIVDEALYNVTSALKSKRMWENTMMVVASDNGGSLTQTYASNFPLRGGKMSWFEGGIRTTAWVTGGVLPPSMRGRNLSSAHPIAVCDWHSTLLALAGADGADGADETFSGPDGDVGGADRTLPVPEMDGINQWPVLSGMSTTPLREEVFVGSGVLIQSNFKLIADESGESRWSGPMYPKVPATGSRDASCSQARPCLFDLVTDYREEHDLSSIEPDMVAKMQSRLAVLMKGVFEADAVPNATQAKVCNASVANGMWITPYDWPSGLAADPAAGS